MQPDKVICYPNGNTLERGDSVRITDEGFISTRLKISADLDGRIGVLNRIVPFLGFAEVCFPGDLQAGLPEVGGVMVEPAHLVLLERWDGVFKLPLLKKYAELEMLASWMQCSVSSAESIERYDELTEPQQVENLCMDYHDLAEERSALMQKNELLAEMLRLVPCDLLMKYGFNQTALKIRQEITQQIHDAAALRSQKTGA